MMKRALLLGMIVACDKGSSPRATRSADPPKPEVARVAIDAAAPDLPPPWKEIPPPTQDQLMCANRGDSWAVSVDAKGVHVAKQTVSEPNTGPALPFALPKDVRGRTHTLAVSEGFLVGTDGGEWGGGLYWFSADGSKHAQLADQNVIGLAPLGADEVMALEGLNHLGLEEGTARWLAHDTKGWHTTATAKLDGGPETFVDSGDAVYTVTPNSLVRIGRDRKVEVMASQPTGILYPDTMAVDTQHRLWIGMRGFVVKVDSSYKVTWYAAATPCASSG